MKIINKYSDFVSRNPFLIILLVLMFSILMFTQLGNLRFENQDNSDMLPEGEPVIDEFDYINNQFAGTDSVQVLIKIDPTVINSTQPRDIRDVEIIEYIDILSKRIELIRDVSSTGNIAKTLRSINNGTLPMSDREIKMLSQPFIGQSISEDYTSSLISVSLEGEVDVFDLHKELTTIIETTPRPSKVSVHLSGERIVDVVMEGLFSSDMGKTSNIALIGILVVILFIFRSFKYGLTPLSTILFANLWSFGFLAFMDRPITSVMTGVSSMIMGIGIDFGIQVVYRFRYEMKDKSPEKAMAQTLSNVIIPMSTTTLAALIGFRAMSLGKLTMMEDIGTMMTYGVLFSMLAALTFVPAILVIGEKYRIRDMIKRFRKKDRKKPIRRKRK